MSDIELVEWLQTGLDGKPFTRPEDIIDSGEDVCIKRLGAQVYVFRPDSGVLATTSVDDLGFLDAHSWTVVPDAATPNDFIVITTVVAQIMDGPMPSAVAIYQISHAAGIAVREAVKAAAREFLLTEEGSIYRESSVLSDSYNWGDAITSIPEEIWNRHGVQSVRVLRLTDETIVVDHDEALLTYSEMEDLEDLRIQKEYFGALAAKRGWV